MATRLSCRFSPKKPPLRGAASPTTKNSVPPTIRLRPTLRPSPKRALAPFEPITTTGPAAQAPAHAPPLAEQGLGHVRADHHHRHRGPRLQVREGTAVRDLGAGHVE